MLFLVDLNGLMCAKRLFPLGIVFLQGVHQGREQLAPFLDPPRNTPPFSPPTPSFLPSLASTLFLVPLLPFTRIAALQPLKSFLNSKESCT